MPEAQSSSPAARSKKHPALAPLIVTLLILCALGICLWQVWSNNAEARDRAQADAQKLAELTQTREELASLLKLSPCEAKRKLAPANSVPISKKSGTSLQKQSSSANKVDAIENACVFLVSTDGKTHLSTGSGFFVAPGYVVTNRHVVEKGMGKAFVTSHGMGQPALGRVIAISRGKNEDYALLQVDLPANAAVTTLPFAHDVKKTDKIGAWGYPDIVGKADPAYARLLRGEDISAVPELSYSEGVVSAVIPQKPSLIVHTAPISPGNSGGPLVNEAGEVVGINTMITLDESSYRQASLAIAAADLLRFLEAQGLKLQQ